jgi:hypothetical protein
MTSTCHEMQTLTACIEDSAYDANCQRFIRGCGITHGGFLQRPGYVIAVLMCRATSQTMDDKLVWTDTVSVFALHDVQMPDVLQQMWGHLRQAVLYFLRFRQNQHQPKHLDEAQDELLRYGCLVQSTWNMQELATFNLHTCMLHVPEQVRLCGAAAFSSEWWVERLMQVFKRVTKYRCTRYPETSAVQHWLMVSALEDMRVRHPNVTNVLDEIRQGRITCAHDSSEGDSWLSAGVLPASSTEEKAVEAALKSVERMHGGDGMRVTLRLQHDHIGRFKRYHVGYRGARVPLVKISTAKSATIKAGKALLRTTASKTAKQDWHALVAYSTEPPSPAAQAYDVAVQAATAVADIAARERHLNDDAAVGTLDVVAHQARTAMHDACTHMHEADLTGGFNAGCAALLANLRSIMTAGEAVIRAAPVHTAAIQGHLHACRQSVGSLPSQCQQPASLAPSSICTLLEIEQLVRWEQEEDGQQKVYRFAVGSMTELEPVLQPELRFETVFCDGSRGRMKRVPTMLRPKAKAVRYKYAVWLDQIECPMVHAIDSKGGHYYIPTNKLSLKG